MPSEARHGDVRLHWRREGDPAGEPVLLIMGLSGSHHDWYRLLPHLADYDVVLFDNRGTGASSPVTGPLTMDDMVADALAVLDAAGMPDAHIHGTSMGGMVAQHLALDHRERVRSLLLSCTTPGGITRHPPGRMLLATALRPFVGATRTYSILEPLLYAQRTRAGRRERLAEDLQTRLGHPTDMKTTLAQVAAIARHDTRDRLHELAGLPVTVVHGDEDALVPIDHGRALAAAIPGARFVVLEGCGHLVSSDDEAAFAAAVREHLASAAAETAAVKETIR